MRPFHIPCGPSTTVDDILDAIDRWAEQRLQETHTALLVSGHDIEAIDVILQQERDQRPHIRARVRAQILQILAEANESARVEG